ncbi:hypothetical protein E2320_011962 [Naja naja]|nr:hypothetical protein E2320_011962 [Naja naja]
MPPSHDRSSVHMLHANTIPLAQSQFGPPKGKIPAFPGPRKPSNLTNYLRGVRAEFALERIAVVCRDLGLGDELAGVRINMYRIDRDFRLWDQLFVVVRFQIPDVDGAALVSNNELGLGGHKAEFGPSCTLFPPHAAQEQLTPASGKTIKQQPQEGAIEKRMEVHQN